MFNNEVRLDHDEHFTDVFLSLAAVSSELKLNQFVKMSKGQRLRALVNERLTAAAEDIFALFERTIAEYEEELCRSKEENERKQQLLDSVLSPRQDVKVEDKQSIKQEEEQLPEFTAVCVKSEEQSSLLQQRQTEHREETQGEDCGRAEADTSLDPHGHLHSETEEQTDNDEVWRKLMETKAEEHNQVCVKDLEESSPESSGQNNIYFSEVGSNAKQCSFCEKTFKGNTDLQRHVLIHSGKRPYICSVCNKGFIQRHHLTSHMTVHTGERPFSCSVCQKTFTQKTNLRLHMATHTGERPFSCPVCNKGFIQKANLRSHMFVHTGERPYSCLECDARFTQKNNLVRHMTVHSGEKAFSCSVCGKGFTSKAKLKIHARTHAGEKALSCSEYDSRFSLKLNLIRHMDVHSGGSSCPHQ